MRNWVCDSSNDFFLCNTQLMMSTLTSLRQANGLTMMSQANDEQTKVSPVVSHEFCSSVQQYFTGQKRQKQFFFSFPFLTLVWSIISTPTNQQKRRLQRNRRNLLTQLLKVISPPLNRCTNFCWHELDKSRGRRRRRTVSLKKMMMMLVIKVSVALFFWPKKTSMHFNFPFPVFYFSTFSNVHLTPRFLYITFKCKFSHSRFVLSQWFVMQIQSSSRHTRKREEPSAWLFILICLSSRRFSFTSKELFEKN